MDLLKELLICVLDLDIDSEKANILLKTVELDKTIKREHRKTVDILVTLNNKKSDTDISIDVEINSNRFEDISFSNILYHEKIVTTVESENSIKDIGDYYFYRLNLNIHKFRDSVGEKRYSYKEDTIYEKLTKN